MKIFIDVDTQVDFCSKKGSLFVPGAEKLYDVWEDLINYARKNKHLIIGSVDSHSYDAWEFKTNTNRGPKGEKPNFPRHCIKGTQGWLKILETFVMNSVFVSDQLEHLDFLYKKENLEAIYFEKEVYSLLSNGKFYNYLRHLIYSQPDSIEFYVFGVATDYCVNETCSDLFNILQKMDDSVDDKVFLIKDAVVGIDKEKSEECIEKLKNLGVIITTAQEVMKSS